MPYGNQGEEVNGFVVGFNGSVDGKGASQFSSNPSLGRSGLNTFETYGYKVSIVSATENTATFIVRKNTTVETQKYTITYEANGAETVHSDAGKQDAYGVVTVKQDVTSGTIATVQDNFYNKYNHTFVKWNTKADTTGVSYNPKDTIKLNDNVTLYAIWKQNTTESTKYIVSFSSNGGSGTTPAEQTVNAGEGISLPKNERMINTSGITRPNPNYISREGYNFVGWYTSSNLCTSTSCSAFAPGMYYKPESGVTLHAIWSPIASQQQEYIVSFNTNGGSSVADKKVSAPNGGYITLPSTTKAGHTFDSWQETGDDILYKVGNSVRISKNTSFDAMWKTNITTTNIYCSINGVSYSSQTEYDTNCKQPISSSVPTNLYTTNVTSNSISLSFTNGTNSRSKCSVYYHTDYEHVKNYNGDMYDGLCGSRTINNLTPNTTYHFKVKAALYTIFNRSVYGDWSDVLSVTTANTGAGIYGGPNTETNTEIPKDWWNNQMVYGASTYQFETTLNRGMQGKEVKELQKFLNSRGFNVEETGYYGDSTKKAVKDFQEMYRKEILDPFGFTEGTGKFGLATMDFVNELLLNNR